MPVTTRGLFLDLPPFNLQTQTVLELTDPTYNLIIRTMLVDGLKRLAFYPMCPNQLQSMEQPRSPDIGSSPEPDHEPWTDNDGDR
jgi:hypothetical protein